MHRTDKEFLLDILEACNRIKNYIAELNYDEFLKNDEKQDAVIRNLEVIGESVKNISPKLKEQYSEINWKAIAGMRDKLIHFYFGIQVEIVWKVAAIETPNLSAKINEILLKEGYANE